MTARLQPYFDLELFLQTVEETRLDGDDMDACLALWETWCDHIGTCAVKAGGRTYRAVWLHEAVETAVDAAWAASPSRGFRLNALAQTLCMCTVHEFLPEVADAGCAPVPPVGAELAAALTKAGLPARAATGMEYARRYAVVTREPFGGACDICALASSCPRSGQTGDAVIELG